MPRPAFEIGGETVAAGARRTVGLPVSVLSDRTPVTLSAHVIHGRLRGPCVFVSAGIHGDEVIGIEIIRRLLKAPGLAKLRGTLIAVPIVNAFGFIARSRYLPDRRDLNRSFPGSEGGSLAARLARLFLSEVVSRADLGIDLHSAAIHRTNYPQIRVAPGAEGIRGLARTFGAPIIMESALRPGSLRAAAAEMGKDILLYEAGEGLRFDEVSVRAGVAGILRVLRSLDMIAARGVTPVRTPSQVCPSSRWLRAPSGGLFRAYRPDGAPVRRGDVLGSISDPFGEIEVDVSAPFDGIIVGRAVMPVVDEGDSVFHLGRVASLSAAEATLDDHSSQIAGDPTFDEDEII